MELEFHPLELRYDRLRIARPDRERRLLSSLAEVGQQVSIMVVKQDGDEHFVVIASRPLGILAPRCRARIQKLCES